MDLSYKISLTDIKRVKLVKKNHLACYYSFRNLLHWLDRCHHGIMGKGDVTTSVVFELIVELLKDRFANNSFSEKSISM